MCLAVQVYAALAKLTEVLQSKSPLDIHCGSKDGQLVIMQLKKNSRTAEADGGFVGKGKVQFLCFPSRTENTCIAVVALV